MGTADHHDFTLQVRGLLFCRRCLKLKLMGVARPCFPDRMTPEMRERMTAALVRTAITKEGSA